MNIHDYPDGIGFCQLTQIIDTPKYAGRFNYLASFFPVACKRSFRT